MQVEVVEFALSLKDYLELAKETDLELAEYGKVVLKIINPNKDRIKIGRKLIGILSTEMSLEESRNQKIGEL